VRTIAVTIHYSHFSPAHLSVAAGETVRFTIRNSDPIDHEFILGDRMRLRAQMQTYAACEDAEISQVVRDGYGDLVAYVQRVSGLPAEEVARFFATGMLMNVLASMQVIENPDPWAAALLDGCGKEL